MAARKQSQKRKKKRSTPTKDPAQSARFLEMAKKLELDESGASFDQALNAIAQSVIARTSPKKASESKK